MLTNSHVTVLRRVPPIPRPAPTEFGADLADVLGGVEDECGILLVGKGRVDLMCALLRAGVEGDSLLFTWAPRGGERKLGHRATT